MADPSDPLHERVDSRLPLEAVERALEPFRQSLEADGYGLHLDAFEVGLLRLSIVAQDGACEECLVPKDLMTVMIQASLSRELGIREITLTYPGEQ